MRSDRNMCALWDSFAYSFCRPAWLTIHSFGNLFHISVLHTCTYFYDDRYYDENNDDDYSIFLAPSFYFGWLVGVLCGRAAGYTTAYSHVCAPCSQGCLAVILMATLVCVYNNLVRHICDGEPRMSPQKNSCSLLWTHHA